MGQVKYIRGDQPNSNMLSDALTVPGYSYKRGKVVPDAKAAWGATDGNRKPLDVEQGKQLLDESLRD
jgi:hypothetical protein